MYFKRKWPRYSISLVFFLLLCCAGFFAGYRQGLNSGYERWLRDTTATREYTVRYDVRDLIASDNTKTSGNSLSAHQGFVSTNRDARRSFIQPNLSTVRRWRGTNHSNRSNNGIDRSNGFWMRSEKQANTYDYRRCAGPKATLPNFEDVLACQ